MSKKRRRPPKKRTRSKPTTDKYKTDKYVEYIFIAELSILNADALLSDLTDGEVVAAVRKLIGQIRKTKGLPRYQEQPPDRDGLIAWLIVQNWNELFDHKRRLSKRQMVGCLEVVVESVETRMRKPHQRKYLTYLKKFMERAGLSVEALDAAVEADDELFYDLAGMSLAQVGSLWLQNPDNWEIADAFENKAQQQITGGEAQAVARLCQELRPQTDDSDIQTILYTVQGQACRQLGQIDQALDLLTTARQMSSDYFDARYELAEIYYEQENYEAAIEAWRECLVGDPIDTYVYHQMAGAYQQMGDLAAEEETWRELLKIQERRGCLPFLRRFRWRYQNFTTLAHLADCLERQGKTAALNQVLAQIDRSQPQPQDTLSDWAYWVRYRLDRNRDADQMLATLEVTASVMHQPIWSDLLQACVYDWLEQPRQSAPLWQKVTQEVPEPRRTTWLNYVYESLGPILPPSSRLFALVQKEVPQD